MKIYFLVQARMGSTRLPNKILRPFYNGKCILELQVKKLQQVPNTDVIIATSVNEDNDIIENFCTKHAIHCFRGSEDNVLQRFIDAAGTFHADRIVRVCSDNPFLELDSIKRLVAKATTSEADYISFNINGLPSIKTHYGFWAEYTTLAALKRVKQLTDACLYHEHVTNFIYANPDKFQIEWIEGPACLKDRGDIRLTCDTYDDFQSSSQIYADLCQSNPYPTIDEVVNYLDNHTEYRSKMVEQIKLNSK